MEDVSLQPFESLVYDTNLSGTSKFKAVMPYYRNGQFDPLSQGFKFGPPRPKEESELLALLVKKRGFYDKLAVGTLEAEFSDDSLGPLQGTSIPLTPAVAGEDMIFLTAKHNVPNRLSARIALTYHQAARTLIHPDEYMEATVLEAGYPDVPSTFSTPGPSPEKAPAAVEVSSSREDDGVGPLKLGNKFAALVLEQEAAGAGEHVGVASQKLRGSSSEDATGATDPGVSLLGKEAHVEDLEDIDAMMLSARTNEAATATAMSFFVPDPEPYELAREDPNVGWIDGDIVAGHGCPGELVDAEYCIDKYGVQYKEGARMASEARKVYRPGLRSVSPGLVMAENDTSYLLSCSFTRGSSGSAISRIETPLAFGAMHYRSERRKDRSMRGNVALKVNARWFYLAYAEHVVPVLLKLAKSNKLKWPARHEQYMKEKLAAYLMKHGDAIMAYDQAISKRCDDLLEHYVLSSDESSS